ncbi:ATP-grasp domain-containing protein [Planococcus shixiaomingii]|uniref:ATP-grasp domain-containing protein n=1 Tax=Planococcus shixiaomingii TaxID=3058393 RepID=UPI002613068E|nr:alpha-L-glutamate ligase [Planococcus sp. N022]WKA56237.1 alpha-L-glutamate ligase [Planococcus sp. N022]
MILLYETEDAQRNSGFIRELQKFGDFELVLWDDWSESGLERLADKLVDSLVLFRTRRPKAARFLEDRGIYLVNRAEVNRIANDKWQAFQLFLMLGVPAVPTFREALDFPYVAKTVDGHGGAEVAFVPSDAEVPHFKSDMIYQPVVEHVADVRVYVIGDEVVGAVRRSSDSDFKANYSLGGSAEKFTVTAAQIKDVLRIARALNSDYIGIDFLLLPDGRHLFNEIEDPVGARSFYKTHDENIAELLVNHLAELKKRSPFRKKDL